MKGNFFGNITIDRYDYKERYWSFKFIDFLITDYIKENECDYIYEKQCKILNKSKELNKIKNIIREVLGFSRYDIENPYVFHKSVPSARNIHVNEAFIIYYGNILRFNSKSNELKFIGFNVEAKNECKIAIVSELWRIMKFYGEFGLPLSILDSGHILAQLKLRIIEKKFSKCKINFNFNRAFYNKVLDINEKSMFINYTIELTDEILCDISNSNISLNKYYLKRKYNYDEEVQRYKEVSEFLKIKTFSESVPKQIPIDFNINHIKFYENILENSKFRESCHSFMGTFSTKNVLESNTNIVNKYIKYIEKYSSYSKHTNVYLMVKRYNNLSDIISIKNGQLKVIKENYYIKYNDILHDSHKNINIDSIPIIIFVTFNINNKEIKGYENMYNSHIAASELIENLSLIISQREYFVRPMKNFNDMYLNKLLRLDIGEVGIYLAMAGRDNYYNYGFCFK